MDVTSRLEVIDTWLITTSIVAEQQERMEELHEPRPSCVQKKERINVYPRRRNCMDGLYQPSNVCHVL